MKFTRTVFKSLALCWAVVAIVTGSAGQGPSWRKAEGYRYFEVEPAGKEAGFVPIDAAVTGVHFTNRVSERLVAMNRVTENGSGVALGDIDGDGWCDVYLCGMETDNALFRNLGNWKFENVTAEAGVAFEKQLATGAVFADVDGDADLDLLVNSIGGGTRLFLNDGKGKFTELTDGRLARRFGSMSMSLGDIDQDGDLDLYVTNYRTIVSKDEFPRVKVEARMQGGQVVLTPPGRFASLPAAGGNVEVFELGERDFLYVNNGSGHFAPVSWTNGNFLNEAGEKLASSPMDWGLSVMMRDLNDDGLIDIVVCNDFINAPDRIWMQEQGLKFRAASLKAIRKVSLASMAVDVADINRDGLDDLFFVEMLSRDHSFRQNHRDNLMKAVFNTRIPGPFYRWEIARNTLFVNRGDGTYAEIAELAGVDASEWSWGAVFMDIDLDGWEDLIVPTGHNHDVQNADVMRRLSGSVAPDSYPQRVNDLQLYPRLATPIIAFRNEGKTAALRFTEKQREWGLDIPGVANGIACADLDNDGDLDLVANRLNEVTLFLRNETARERIAVRLVGSKPNTRGVGAKITVRGGPDETLQTQRMISGGRYLSNDDYIRVFASRKEAPVQVEIDWPNGTRSLATSVKPNSVIEISQEGAKPSTAKLKAEGSAFFKDVSGLLNHRNADPSFNDFDRQPSLPYSQSSQGPALAWGDLDRDGRDDLVIGASRGGRANILGNSGDGFVPTTNRFTSRIHVEDMMGLLVGRIGTNEAAILNANANYESGTKHGAAVEISGAETVPGTAECPGIICMADVDSDGDLDLFVGGRVMPGRYGVAVSSRVYLNDSGRFLLSTEFSKSFDQVGLVTSAQFSDFNDDGRPDLVVALEWGPLRVYINSGKAFEHESRGLEGLKGWWTSVVTGDFNNDGLTDIVAGNWGRNTPYERFLRRPIRFMHGDFDGNGRYDLCPAIFSEQVGDYVPFVGPEMFIEMFPPAADRLPSFEAYAKSSVKDLLGNANAHTLEINTMDTTMFLNRGSSFEARALPLEAQFSPVFGTAVLDFDNDGKEDLVLGQNLFETRWEMGKFDSGRPLLLKGDGKGGFRILSSTESGIAADGQQRAVAVSDFNGDGRMDVAMSQNNGETKLFQNMARTAGVRMRFRAGPQNPNGIGVRYQLSGESPVREVQAGGGWLAQNSAVQVIARPPEGARMQVIWPGGRKTQVELKGQATEVIVSESGIEAVQ